MAINLEWKARATDFAHQRAIAETLTGSPAVLIEQTDTFFPSSSGRFKLRRFSEDRGELIHYHRPDDPGAKRSEYRIASTCQPDVLAKVLSNAVGVIGVVRKKRWLYLVGQARIHFDEVDGLGQFIEVEVVMQEGQSTDEAKAIASDIMEAIEVAEKDWIAVAYLDLLSQGPRGLANRRAR